MSHTDAGSGTGFAPVNCRPSNSMSSTGAPVDVPPEVSPGTPNTTDSARLLAAREVDCQVQYASVPTEQDLMFVVAGARLIVPSKEPVPFNPENR